MTVAAMTRNPVVRLLSLPGRLDPSLMLAVAALASIGVVMVASASVTFADDNYGDAMYFLKRHLFYLVLGCGAAAVILRVPSRIWLENSRALLIMALVLLMLVLIPGVGREVNGARRWLALGPLNLQVAEVAKLLMVIFTAGYLKRHQRRMREQWQGFAAPVAMLAAVVLLLLIQPDFGSAVVISGTVLALLFLAGVKLWVFLCLLGAGGGMLALLAVASPYRMQRLVTFLDPWADQYNTGYQLTQSLIAFGRGEWLGVGLGNSIQKLFYLPEAHTDFVFAIFAEEFGLLGVLVMVALYALLIQRIFVVARWAVRRQDWFAAYSAFGIGVLMGGQAFINIGVTSGLLPTKGLTLPFVSYGGSSLLISFAMVALVLRIGAEMDDAAWGRAPGRQKGEGGR
jgi:cell division protein FtsW